MKQYHHSCLCVVLSLVMLFGLTACDLFKKKIPPNQLYSTADTYRKNDNMLEAAKNYDELIAQHDTSELVPAALYYSGICKYTLSLRAPGKREFEQREAGLSETKQSLYSSWLEYMEDHSETFSYKEAPDTYLYQGNEFKRLVESYPSSNLLDDAAFQLLRTNILEKRKTNTLTLPIALQQYAEYFTTYPHSPYRQKGVEHLLQLIIDSSGPMVNPEEIASAYQELARGAENLPGVKQVAYLLAKTLLEGNETQYAAAVLGVPSVLGLGFVATQQTGLNIRSGQGLQYRIVSKAAKGEELLLLGKSGLWYHVRLQDGTDGYAHGDFVQEF